MRNFHNKNVLTICTITSLIFLLVSCDKGIQITYQVKNEADKTIKIKYKLEMEIDTVYTDIGVDEVSVI